MKKFNFKQEQRARLMSQCDERREVFHAVYKDLSNVANKVEDLRTEVLWKYDSQFCFRNKDAAEYWSQIETALDGLYGAMDALRSLSAIELCKWGKLHSPA